MRCMYGIRKGHGVLGGKTGRTNTTWKSKQLQKIDILFMQGLAPESDVV